MLQLAAGSEPHSLPRAASYCAHVKQPTTGRRHWLPSLARRMSAWSILGALALNCVRKLILIGEVDAPIVYIHVLAMPGWGKLVEYLSTPCVAWPLIGKALG